MFDGENEPFETDTWNVIVMEHKLTYRFLWIIFLMLKIMNLVTAWDYEIVFSKYVWSVLVTLINTTGSWKCTNINSNFYSTYQR